MLTLQQIIDEAATLVPNEVPIANQIIWLNSINGDFFNKVKIPKIEEFITVKGQKNYTLPIDVREKNVDLVMCGVLKHRRLQSDDVSPLQNSFAFNDTSHALTLYPPPYADNLIGTIRYHRIATTTFLSSNLAAVPDCPEEYQWTYFVALASYLADTLDDSENASNYSTQYLTAWNAAQIEYQGVGV